MMLEKLQRAHPTLHGHFASDYLVGSNMLRAYLFFIYGKDSLGVCLLLVVHLYIIEEIFQFIHQCRLNIVEQKLEGWKGTNRDIFTSCCTLVQCKVNILVYTFLLAGRSGRIWDGWKGTNGEQCSDTQACDTTTI